MNKYLTLLSKAKFEQYVKNKINNFLKAITDSRTELQQAKSYRTVVDKDLYKSIFASPSSKVIWLPCFECDKVVKYFFQFNEERRR